MLTSASGKIFLSYLPDETTASLVAAEFDGLKTAKKSEQGKMVRKICDEVRRRGMATSEGTYRPHTNIAVPIFDHQGKLVLSISLLGLKGSFSTAPEAPIPMALKTTATELSRRLGARI